MLFAVVEIEQDPAIVTRVYAAKGDSLAVDELIRDYMPFIRAQAAKSLGRVPVVGQDEELSIAMIAFHEAVESYSRTRGAFVKYCAVVIKRRLIDHHRKESRHVHSSLDVPVHEDGVALGDTLTGGEDHQERYTQRQATQEEIAELTRQLTGFGVSLTDIADNCPRQERTRQAVHRALAYAVQHAELIQKLKQSGRVPLAELVLGTGIERKTLERHRKYLLALMVIYSNGYEIIRGHLKQIAIVKEVRT